MSGENVIQGKDGWLFLEEGSNSSISQVTGKVSIEAGELNRWARILKFRNALLGDRYRTLVCPEKACVYPTYLPDQYKIAPGRTVAKIRNSTQDLIYPCAELVANKEHLRAYPKTDTHFSAIGSAIVAQSIARSFGLEPSSAYQELEYNEREVVGDLGLKFEDPIKNLNYFCSNFPGIDILDNGLKNRGRISCYTNPNCDGPTLLLYGDSFSGINLAMFLSLQFRTVYFVHSGAIDYTLVDRLKPDYVVCEYAERFMSTAPVEATPISSVIIEKKIMNTYNDAMMVEFFSKSEEFSIFYGDDEFETLRRYCAPDNVNVAA